LKRAIRDIEENVFCGIRIPRKIVPREYVLKHGVESIMKYDLPRGWRLIYSISSDKNAEILAILLEWFDHKGYEKRFGYKVREKVSKYFR